MHKFLNVLKKIFKKHNKKCPFDEYIQCFIGDKKTLVNCCRLDPIGGCNLHSKGWCCWISRQKRPPNKKEIQRYYDYLTGKHNYTSFDSYLQGEGYES